MDFKSLLLDLQNDITIKINKIINLIEQSKTIEQLKTIDERPNNICEEFDNLLDEQDELNELINFKRRTLQTAAPTAPATPATTPAPTPIITPASTAAPTAAPINKLYKLSTHEREQLLEQIYLKAVSNSKEKYPNLTNEELEPLIINEADVLLKLYL
jgi:hypothetical protein